MLQLLTIELTIADCYGVEPGQERATSPEAERRFQMWKATTSALILESMNEDERENQQHIEAWAREFSRPVLDAIVPLVRDSDEGILENLTEIIRNFIHLDQKICRQAARVGWLFPPSTSSLCFDPDSMVVEVGAPTPQRGQRVAMVVAPGLKKRGRSTGESFEVEYLLLKMEVLCG